jgi:hypothetical protein
MTKLEKKARRAYEKTGPSAVYELTALLALEHRYCAPCDCDTPRDPETMNCLLCGQDGKK